MKRKWHLIYEPYRAFFVVGVIIAATLYSAFIAHDLYLRNKLEECAIFAFMGLVCFSLLFIYAPKDGLLIRFGTVVRFTEDGLECFTPFWGRYRILWDEIHSYGIFHSSYEGSSYMACDLMYFSKDKERLPRRGKPLDRKEKGRIGRDRILIQYRDDIWAEMQAVLPEPLKMVLADSLRSGRDCHARR